MTQKNLPHLVVLWLFILGSLHCAASHNRGAHIGYKRVAPFSKVVGGQTIPVYEYLITVVRCHNSGSSTQVADRCADTVYFGDGQRGIAYRSNGSPCAACGTTVGCGDPLAPSLGGKVSTYTIQHTYAGAGSYMIRSFDPNRSQDIINIPNAVNQPFFIQSLLIINANMANENSVTFTEPDAYIAELGTCFNHTVPVTDADGDSLSYVITTPLGINGQPVPGYSYPDAGSGGMYMFVGNMLMWCHTQQLGLYTIAYEVQEWRKNSAGTYQVIGSVLRDLEVTVKLPAGIAGETYHLPCIFPNPASDDVQVSLIHGRAVDYSLFSLTGEKVRAGQGRHHFKITLHDLPAGLYVLEISDGETRSCERILKK